MNAVIGEDDAHRITDRERGMSAIAIQRCLNNLIANVSSRTFLGEKTEYHVAVGDQVIQATLYGDGRHSAFAVGDSVRVVLPDDGINLMRP